MTLQIYELSWINDAQIVIFWKSANSITTFLHLTSPISGLPPPWHDKAGLITLPLICLSVIDLENFDRVAGTERLARLHGIDKILFGELSGETGSVAAAVPRLDADERSIE